MHVRARGTVGGRGGAKARRRRLRRGRCRRLLWRRHVALEDGCGSHVRLGTKAVERRRCASIPAPAGVEMCDDRLRLRGVPTPTQRRMRMHLRLGVETERGVGEKRAAVF